VQCCIRALLKKLPVIYQSGDMAPRSFGFNPSVVYVGAVMKELALNWVRTSARQVSRTISSTVQFTPQHNNINI
jgi:hypothetical protein